MMLDHIEIIDINLNMEHGIEYECSWKRKDCQKDSEEHNKNPLQVKWHLFLLIWKEDLTELSNLKLATSGKLRKQPVWKEVMIYVNSRFDNKSVLVTKLVVERKYLSSIKMCTV